MASVRLICALKPYIGEEWLLKRTRKGLALLDEDDSVVTLIPTGEVTLRIHFPSFLESRVQIVITGDGGKELLFEPKEKAIRKIRALIDDCVDDDPTATALAYRGKATRDLLIGGGSFLLGMIITCGTLLFAEPDGKFTVMGGLIVVGLVEIGRGIYFAIQANTYSQLAESEEDQDDDDDD